ncbi:ATP-binding cassette domain-containing protein [Mycoplasma marinum]|nr:ATP-binding cassette domain-containing protein [Mycoplasma marinum]
MFKNNMNKNSTDLNVSKIITNVNFVTQARIFNLFEIISNSFSLIFAISLLMYYHWSYGVLAAFFAITLSLLPILYRKKYNNYQSKIIKIDNEYKGEMGILINQRNPMYLINKLNIINNIAARLTLGKNKNSYKIYKKMIITFSPNIVFGLISQIFAPILSAILAHYGMVSVTLVGISAYIFGTALSTLIVLPELIKSFVSSKSIMNDLLKSSTRTKMDFISKVEIKGINPIINKTKIFSSPISFNINNNSKLNIVGRNGSGKSSLLNILKGQLLTFEGKFVVNDILNPSLLGQEGVVFLGEKPYIFNGTVKENISLFNESINDAEIIKALEEVNLKLKLNEKISNDAISDGQKQKISIARAFIYNSNILFLDETLNNIDMKSKNIIEKKLLAKKMGVIIISHKEVSNEFKKIKIN